MQIVADDTLWQHDFVRSARMASYGFLLYGPLSDWWYKLLDSKMPAKNLANFSSKVCESLPFLVAGTSSCWGVFLLSSIAVCKNSAF